MEKRNREALIFELRLEVFRILIISVSFLFPLHAHSFSPSDSTDKGVDSTNLLSGVDLQRVPGTDTLFRFAEKYLGKWAYLFMAIKLEESGNDGHYSWLSVKHFNLCGMRYPRMRRTYAIASTRTNYAIYRNWFESMLDFKIYMENVEERFIQKNKRLPKTDVEMIHFMYNSFNHFAKWKKDMLILIRYVKKKYRPSSAFVHHPASK